MKFLTIAASALAASLALSGPGAAATANYTGTPGLLVDAETALAPVLVDASDFAGEVLSGLTLSLGFSVCGGFFDTPLGDCARPLSHTANRDLSLWLVSPDGTRVDLVLDSYAPGGPTYGDQFEASSAIVLFDDAASLPVGGDVIATGTFRPASPLAGLIGETPLGTWQIGIGDLEARSPKRLDSYSLTLVTEPAPVPLPSALPMMAAGLGCLTLLVARRRRSA